MNKSNQSTEMHLLFYLHTIGKMSKKKLLKCVVRNLEIEKTDLLIIF